MSEQAPQFESSIERTNVRLSVEMGSRAILFDYLNTCLYEHAEGYDQFDHVFRVNDNRESGVFFPRSTYGDLYTELVKHDFPRNFRRYPTPQDEAVFVALWDEQLAADLEALAQGTDPDSDS